MIELTEEELEAIIKAVANYEEIIDGEVGECRSIDEIHKAGAARPVYQMLLDIQRREKAKSKAEMIINDVIEMTKHLAQNKK